MRSILLAAILCQFSYSAFADEPDGDGRIVLKSPKSTFESCSLKITGNAPKQALVHRLEACLTKNAQRELAVYLYLGASVAAAFHEAGDKKKDALDDLDKIEKKYGLQEIFANASSGSDSDILDRVDVISLTTDLFGYLNTYADSTTDNALELKDLEIVDNRASGLEVQRGKPVDEAERVVLFLKVEDRWLIDGWANPD